MCDEARGTARAEAARATLDQLRAVLARGATLKQAGQAVPELNGSQWRAYRLAAKHNLPRRRRNVPPEKERRMQKELRRAKLTLDQIAKLVEVSKATVWRRGVARDGAGPRSARKYFCQGCRHWVNLRPCQICRVLEAQN